MRARAAASLRPGAVRALWKAVSGQRRPGQSSAWTSMRTLPRLLAATATGRYHGTSPGQLALMLLALGYIASPVDVLPEVLLGAGLLDDAVVLAWLAGALLAETDAFLAWEDEQHGRPPRRPPSGSTRGGPAGGPGGGTAGGRPGDPPGGPDVVVGEVVR